MKEIDSIIISNKPVADDIYQLKLKVENFNYEHGQFAMIKVPSFFLRRPFGIADVEENQITFFYKIVKDGTKMLSTLSEGYKINLLLPLGKGFPKLKPDALIAGGYGLVPFYGLIKNLSSEGYKVPLFFGAGSKNSMFRLEDFEKYSDLHLATVDGSAGEKCLVTDLLKKHSWNKKTVFACGPTPMLKCLAVWAKKEDVNLFVSVESRMGCGWGACLGCAVPKTGGGYYHACKDGPVFHYKDLDWDNYNE